MKDVIIACAGGFGLEAYVEIQSSNYEARLHGKEPPYRFLGFLSDIPVDLESIGIHEKILGTIKDWKPGENEFYFVGLAKPEQKKMVSDILASKGANFTNIISPYAIVSSTVKMGCGCLITGGSSVSYGVKLGSFVSVMGSMLYAGAQIGDYTTTTGYTVIERAILGQGVFCGSKAVVTEGCTVGDWSQVYTGSVVMEDVKPNVQVFGMPAKEM